ncbi:peptide MFS transporter [Roseimaritima sediminicola]|uniref:peptide MFS transporter n=1 Tax=Roseimaritima sediminicola TaxID=2662066 RepID=UPI0012984462|nr:oligopeptide:H+ symporter [Roseimaritima sediminicola]
MSTSASAPEIASQNRLILHHQPGLFVLFFTEMWERFSYYGMRALLVLFLTASLFEEGWGWGRAEALQLYAFYTGLVYVTPIFGGILADKLLGYRLAVVLGALIMTIGHASMALETVLSFYTGLVCLILGNGLFKPNISSIVGQLYQRDSDKRDAAYTIFYMGINAGAFLGILLCGYIGEKVGWRYGFGLAGIFMFLGMVQFYFAQNIFGELGKRPKSAEESRAEAAAKPEQAGEDGVEEAPRHVQRDRVFVIMVFAFFTIFFWWAFEQAGGSMTIFAADYTDRVLEGGAATTYKIANTLLTVLPLMVVTWVLFLLFRVTFSQYTLSNLCLGLSFVIIWGIAIWLIQNDFKTKSYIVRYTDITGIAQTTKVRTTQTYASGDEIRLTYNKNVELYDPEAESYRDHRVADGMIRDGDGNRIAAHFETTIAPIEEEQARGLFWKTNRSTELRMQALDGTELTHHLLLPAESELKEGERVQLMVTDQIELADGTEEETVVGTVQRLADDEVEVPASWFGILNSFYIIVFAPFFSRFWEMNIIRSGPIKFALGLILLGIGFGALSFGSLGIEAGAKVAQVSMVWLILAYLFHTLGELCISPVGLSYVSKLAPARLVGLMFGIWFVANFIANFAAGLTGSFIDQIAEQYALWGFFMIFTLIPIGAGVILILLNGVLHRMMHGID